MVSFLALSVLLSLALCGANGADKLVLSSVSQEIDLTTSMFVQRVTMVVENQGSKPVAEMKFTVGKVMADKLSFIAAKLEREDSDMELMLSETTPPGSRIIHMPALNSGKSVTIKVEAVFINSLKPHPSSINQNDQQLIQFSGNVYLYSPYPSTTQSTIIKLPNEKIESFTKVNPTSSSGSEIVYGPYSNVEPESFAKITVHFENNGPFLSIAELERIIEVSHWGNIAIEEHLHIRHTGAILKGSFSRFDFQRNPNSGPSCVKSFTSLLPASAKDAYYRDEIGNISTSHLRDDEDFVSLEIRPRFPLFGGWQTKYYMGYNLPSYEYLYHTGNQFALKMRFVDHVFNNQLVEKATVKIILPEGAKDIDLSVPYSVDEQPRQLHFTYLDTVGRPVVTVTAENLVEQHIQDFQLSYSFDKIMLLQEPLLLVGALYFFFLIVVVIVRLDFSITKDAGLLAKQQASVILESILSAHDRRAALVPSYEKAITSYKSSQDSKQFKAAKKSLDDQFNGEGEKVAGSVKDLHSVDPEAGAKVAELQRKVSELKAALDESCQLAEGLVNQRIGTQKYTDQDKACQSRITRLVGEVNNIAMGLD